MRHIKKPRQSSGIVARRVVRLPQATVNGAAIYILQFTSVIFITETNLNYTVK